MLEKPSFLKFKFILCSFLVSKDFEEMMILVIEHIILCRLAVIGNTVFQIIRVKHDLRYSKGNQLVNR